MEDLDNPARIMTGYNPDNLFNSDAGPVEIMEDELKEFGLQTKMHKQYPDAIDYDKLKKNKTKAIEWLKKNWRKEQGRDKEWLWVDKPPLVKKKSKHRVEIKDDGPGLDIISNKTRNQIKRFERGNRARNVLSQVKLLKGGRRKTRKKRGGERNPHCNCQVGDKFTLKDEGYEHYQEDQGIYKITKILNNYVYFNDGETDFDDEKNVIITQLRHYFEPYNERASTPGGRKKKRKGRCTKKKRRRHR